MQRCSISPRPDWQAKVESQGFHFHTLEENGQSVPYWDESAYYRFNTREIDVLEKASYALNDLCLQAVEHVVTNGRLGEFHIPAAFHDYVQASWEQDEHTVVGRFDLAYDGVHPPRLLEYNADTPTSLLEAAVIQWFWLKDQLPALDQFNSIHERLIEAWKVVTGRTRERWYFASLAGNVEDYLTVNYLRDTAIQAGLETEYLAIEEIGWNEKLSVFRDKAERTIHRIFKLYPWEWLLRDEFGANIPRASTQWLEAPWKMILSNKAILPVLSELFPDSPHVLKAQWKPLGRTYVKKPILGREGANQTIMLDGKSRLETGGPYADEPCIYQEYVPLACHEGRYAVIGSWMVNGYACGIGIREDDSPVTQNTSRFVPHVIG